ncbi:MAG: ribosome maturation factor RimM [Kutzneria sp.]|nr:ribosome maturation factor RimM [Kutzneria sp.]MBV9845337.1 ribosome maturation factor RimM [Kutzneria sp.]
MSTPTADVRVVGRVVRPHGVRGELVVEVRTDSPEERFVPGALLLTRSRDGVAGTATVVAARPHAGRLLVEFAGVTDRDAAEAMRGVLLLVDAAALPPTDDPDEFHDRELEGLVVRSTDGDHVGVVREILHGPGGDLLVVERAGASEVLVPFVHAIVPVVDPAGGHVVIDPPAGLLDNAS